MASSKSNAGASVQAPMPISSFSLDQAGLSSGAVPHPVSSKSSSKGTVQGSSDVSDRRKSECSSNGMKEAPTKARRTSKLKRSMSMDSRSPLARPSDSCTGKPNGMLHATKSMGPVKNDNASLSVCVEQNPGLLNPASCGALHSEALSPTVSPAQCLSLAASRDLLGSVSSASDVLSDTASTNTLSISAKGAFGNLTLNNILDGNSQSDLHSINAHSIDANAMEDEASILNNFLSDFGMNDLDNTSTADLLNLTGNGGILNMNGPSDLLYEMSLDGFNCDMAMMDAMSRSSASPNPKPADAPNIPSIPSLLSGSSSATNNFEPKPTPNGASVPHVPMSSPQNPANNVNINISANNNSAVNMQSLNTSGSLSGLMMTRHLSITGAPNAMNLDTLGLRNMSPYSSSFFSQPNNAHSSTSVPHNASASHIYSAPAPTLTTNTADGGALQQHMSQQQQQQQQFHGGPLRALPPPTQAPAFTTQFGRIGHSIHQSQLHQQQQHNQQQRALMHQATRTPLANPSLPPPQMYPTPNMNCIQNFKPHIQNSTAAAGQSMQNPALMGHHPLLPLSAQMSQQHQTYGVPLRRQASLPHFGPSPTSGISYTSLMRMPSSAMETPDLNFAAMQPLPAAASGSNLNYVPTIAHASSRESENTEGDQLVIPTLPDVLSNPLYSH